MTLLDNIEITAELDDEAISFSINGAANEDANEDAGMISQPTLFLFSVLLETFWNFGKSYRMNLQLRFFHKYVKTILKKAGLFSGLLSLKFIFATK